MGMAESPLPVILRDMLQSFSVKPEAAMGELLKFDVEQHCQVQFLATRAKGHVVREDLEDLIARERPDGVLIDFVGVEAMTISFADEFLGRFYASLAAGDVLAQTVLLLGLNEENLATVSICLERRDLAAVAIIDGHPTLLSTLEHLVETYEAALNLGTFSALELAAGLAVTPQNMNNRLKRLVEAGAIRRRRVHTERGGKEFAYTASEQLHESATCENAQ